MSSALKRGRRPPPATEAVGPTPQTRARLRKDVLLDLYVHGGLTPAQLLAAERIQDQFEALTRPLWPRVTDYGRGPAARGNRGYVQPIERLSEGAWRRWREYYKPWANEVGHWELITPAGRRTVLSVVIAVAVDAWSLSDLARAARMVGVTGRPTRAGLRFFGEALRLGLDRYCEIAGIG